MVRSRSCFLALFVMACDPGSPPPAAPESTPIPTPVPAPEAATEDRAEGGPETAEKRAPEPDSASRAAGPATVLGELCAGPRGMPNLVAGIRPAEPVDSVELRKVMAGDTGPMGETVARAGTPCGGARDGAACIARLETALSDQGFGFGCRPLLCHEVVVFTRGDAVEVVDDLAGLVAFLGEVDTVAEAALLLRAHRYQPGTCEEITGGSIQRTDAGFRAKVVKRIADCPVQYADYELRVSRTGSVSVVSETKRPVGPNKMCI